MDKTKIGKFIAECRKDKQLTQEQLAEMIDVTNKSVSKWENGNCLPEPSLYEPLCGILGVTINELFAGQRIPERDYKSIADANLLNVLKYRLYLMTDKSITFEQFGSALDRISEVTQTLKAFGDKEKAVRYLMQGSHCGYDECAAAYDFYLNMFQIGESSQEDKSPC